MKEKITNWLLLLSVFLLPWQTQWIVVSQLTEGGISQYGRLALVISQAIMLLVTLLRGRPHYATEQKGVVQAGYVVLSFVFFSLAFTRFFSVGMAQTLQIIFAFLLLSHLCDRRTQYKQVVMAFVLGLLIPVALGWWQVLTGGSPESMWLGLAQQNASTIGTAVVETDSGRLLRAYGSFPHPNIFGGFLAVGLFALFGIVRLGRSHHATIFVVLSTILMSSTLILTFSRGAWLGVLLGFFTVFILMWYGKRPWSFHQRVVVMVASVSIIATIGLFHQQVFSRVLAQGMIEEISVTERVSQYQQFIQVVSLNPVFGVGPGAYTFALAKTQPGGEVWNYQPVHNVFLLVAGELGLLGLLVWLHVLWKIIRMNVPLLKTEEGALNLGLGIAVLVIGSVDHYVWSLWPGLALTALVAFLIVPRFRSLKKVTS